MCASPFPTCLHTHTQHTVCDDMCAQGADCYVLCVCVCVCRFKVLVDMRALGTGIIKEFTLGSVDQEIYVNKLYDQVLGDGVAPDVRFQFNDQVITPDKFFSEYNIESGATITLLPRGRGGMDAGAGCAPPLPPPA